MKLCRAVRWGDARCGQLCSLLQPLRCSHRPLKFLDRPENLRPDATASHATDSEHGVGALSDREIHVFAELLYEQIWRCSSG